jgi:branched-chain amino acid transport system permease protein
MTPPPDLPERPTWTAAHLAVLAALALVAAAAPLWLRDAYWASLIVGTAITLVLTMSMNLINGTAGQFTLSHAAFFGLGAYAAAVGAQDFGLAPWLCLPLAVIVGAGVALAVGVPLLRLQSYYLATGTLAFALIVEIVVRQSPYLGGPLGFADLPALRGFGANLTGAAFVPVAGFAALLVYIAIRNLMDAPLGRAVVAARDDAPAAAAAGIAVARMRLTIFVIAAAMAAAAGWLDACYVRNITPQVFGADLTFRWLLIILIGGIGDLSGVVIATVLLSLAPELLGVAAGQQVLALGILMIVVILFAPRGLGGLIADIRRRLPRRGLA